MFALRFPHDEIIYWASRYKYPNEDILVNEVVPRVRADGFFSKSDFLFICRWKTPRTKPRCEKNPEDFIRAITQTALNIANERLRVEVLTLLEGVKWPTASVILHFAHTDPYPILDYRALWSVGADVPRQYDFDFWWTYTGFCRDLTGLCGVSMRVLDRAPWQYSKENQTANAAYHRHL